MTLSFSSISFQHIWISKEECDESSSGCSLPLCRAMCHSNSGIMWTLFFCVSDVTPHLRGVEVVSSGGLRREGSIGSSR